jgi:hypothetical protein
MRPAWRLYVCVVLLVEHDCMVALSISVSLALLERLARGLFVDGTAQAQIMKSDQNQWRLTSTSSMALSKRQRKLAEI